MPPLLTYLIFCYIKYQIENCFDYQRRAQGLPNVPPLWANSRSERSSI